MSVERLNPKSEVVIGVIGVMCRITTFALVSPKVEAGSPHTENTVTRVSGCGLSRNGGKAIFESDDEIPIPGYYSGTFNWLESLSE